MYMLNMKGITLIINAICSVLMGVQWGPTQKWLHKRAQLYSQHTVWNIASARDAKLNVAPQYWRTINQSITVP